MLSTKKNPTRKPSKRTAPVRDPERTRTHLLRTAAREVYRSGFQGTGLDRILSKAEVTKGALYHYFDSKEALGYAIVDEIIVDITREKWLRPLAESTNPIDTLIEIVKGTSLSPENVEGGCPLNNISQEMSPLDEGFRKRAARVFRDWRDAIASALHDGQKRGQVRNDLDTVETATFLVALYEGYISLAKNAQDPSALRSGLKTMTRHLETLRQQG
jgi:TetR/AcrR family transcriptional regulator, transcriptional repressor for nem operon